MVIIITELVSCLVLVADAAFILLNKIIVSKQQASHASE